MNEKTVIEYLNIEKTVIEYLNEELDVPCYLEIPGKPPVTFVAVEKTGSSEQNMIISSTFAVQSYAGSMVEAIELNEAVKDTMRKIVELDSIAACDLNSDYNFTDTVSKRYRYQAVFDIKSYRRR